MKRTITWLAAGMFLLPLGAQGRPAPAEDAKTRLKNLLAEQKEIISAWQKQARESAKAAEKAAEGAKNGKSIPAMAMRPDFTELRGKYLAAAKKYPGEAAVSFLLQALEIGSTPAERKEVVELLLDEHLDSPQLHELGGVLPYLDKMVSADYAAEAGAKIEKHGKNLVLLGWLAFARNEKTLRSEPATSKAFLDAKAAASAAIAQAEDKFLQQQFDALLAEQERFAIGMVAPEISGVDLDGVAFQLSDSRGKVVFLDFWGDWSSPCRAMYLHERALVQELKDKPFALVGVNSDQAEVAKTAVAANKLNWRSFQNKPEGQEHAISDDWFIRGWPTIVVLDTELKIRYRGNDGAEAIKVLKQTLALGQ